MPKVTRGAYTQAQHVWVYSWAKDCRYSWKKGFHGIIHDGFELEPYDFDLVSTFGDSEKEIFKNALKIAEDSESPIHCLLVHEDSIMAEVMDPVSFGEDHLD